MNRGRRHAVAASGVAVAALLVTAGCSPGDAGGAGGDTAPSADAEAGSAAAAVDGLAVKGRAPRTGYDRDRFGSAWADTDSNSCGTRDDILRRDLDDVRFRDGDCEVVSGVLPDDPYTGKELRFTKGRSTVDIDHLVALSDAWQKGASQWDPSKRIALANDPLNLLAVEAGANRTKGDADAATWLPPNKAYRCEYVAGQVAVKRKYELWVTPAERDARFPGTGPAPGGAGLPGFGGRGDDKGKLTRTLR
ncbi:HNH endonuclease family protein, partial [Streptomyces sp. NPDC048845]|uniref:HNH endonuclease family protein n=1 Tax=Streptomyces sp. NPDC048845 TaxID=3155390 RepID=UPI0034278ED2